MVLTSAEIAQKNIVGNSVTNGQRATTYDATVGSIIEEGCEIAGRNYTLQPRGIVWVVSAETFRLPGDVTGLATLRTTWTHDGILALNVGIVDPGWNGPLAAALVNFSNTNFIINKEDTFLRILFHSHTECNPIIVFKNNDIYKKEIISKSRIFSKSFLSMDRLVSEVIKEVFYFPKIVFYIAILGTVLTLLTMFSTMALEVWLNQKSLMTDIRARLEVTEKLLDDLKERPSAEVRLKDLEDRLNRSWW